ncbi:MAG: hypothetical protein VXV95_00345, partial [Candidatus Thermoplasmatota archaeon]|nr:hypothetical protein [Candidatus Thermoplasmatota archaeon]
MAERGRLLIVLLAVLIISSLIPHSNAERTDSNAIEIQINELEESYIAGDTIRFNPILLNPSNATQFHNDPSCDYVFEIYDNDNAMVFSSASKCKKIVQAIELLEGEQLELMTHLWDFTDNRGLELASGTYTSIVRHSFLPISDSSTFNYYASSTVPNDIEIKHNIIDISNERSSAYLIQLIIHNPTPKKFDVGGLNCDIVIKSSINRHILSDCLKNIHTLHPYENLYVGSHIFQGDWLEQSDEIKIEFTGSNRYNPVQLPNTHILLQGDNSSENVINVTGLNYRLIDETEGSYLSIVAEYAPAKLLEIDNCLMDLHIANDYGKLVENKQINLCRLLPVESADSNEKHQYEVHRWNLTDEQNCNIDFGKYTVVLGSNLFTSVDFFQQLPNTLTKCINKDFEVDISNHLVEDSLYNSVKISGEENFRITSKCLNEIHLEFNSAQVDNITEISCAYNIGSFFSPPNGIFEFEQKIELPKNLVEGTEIILKNTIYSERIYLNLDIFYVESDGLTENPEASFAVSGMWDLIEHKDSQCWVLNSPNSAYILEGHNLDSIWSPKQGWHGEYAITEHQPDSSYCSQFG